MAYNPNPILSSFDKNKDGGIDTLDELTGVINFLDELTPDSTDRNNFIKELNTIEGGGVLESSFGKELYTAYANAKQAILNVPAYMNRTSTNPALKESFLIIDVYEKLPAGSRKDSAERSVTKKMDTEYIANKIEVAKANPLSSERQEMKLHELKTHNHFVHGTYEQKKSLSERFIQESVEAQKMCGATNDVVLKYCKKINDTMVFDSVGVPSIFGLKSWAHTQKEECDKIKTVYENALADMRKKLSGPSISQPLHPDQNPHYKLLISQANDAKIASEMYQDLIDGFPDNEDDGGMMSGLGRTRAVDLVPIAGSVQKSVDTGHIQSIIDRKDGAGNLPSAPFGGGVEGMNAFNERNKENYEGSMSMGSEMLYSAYAGISEMSSKDFGSGHNIGHGIGQMTGFLGEMAMYTSILAPLGLVGGLARASRAQKLVAALKGGLAYTTLGTASVIAATKERMLPKLGLKYDEKEGVVVYEKAPGDGIIEATVKGYATTYTEFFTAQIGGEVVKRLGKSYGGKITSKGMEYIQKYAGTDTMRKTLVDGLVNWKIWKLTKDIPGVDSIEKGLQYIVSNYGDDFLQKNLQRHGIWAEYVEEFLSGKMQKLETGDDGGYMPRNRSRTLREEFETIATVAIVGKAMKPLGNIGSGKVPGKKGAESKKDKKKEKSHEFISESEFNAKYKDHIGAIAIVDSASGKININQKKRSKLTFSQKKEVVMHERRHQYLLTLPMLSWAKLSTAFKKDQNMCDAMDTYLRSLGYKTGKMSEYDKINEVIANYAGRKTTGRDPQAFDSYLAKIVSKFDVFGDIRKLNQAIQNAKEGGGGVELQIAAMLGWFRNNNKNEGKNEKKEERFVDEAIHKIERIDLTQKTFSPEANQIISSYPELTPSYKIITGGKEFFLCEAFRPVSNRNRILGYVNLQGVLTPRVFYFSKSGGNWHGPPGSQTGIISKGDFVKNLSYEKGTVIDNTLQNACNHIVSSKKGSVSKDPLEVIDEEYGIIYATSSGVPKMKLAKQFKEEVSVCSDLISNENPNTIRAYAFHEVTNVSQIQQRYSNMKLNNLNFNNTSVRQGPDGFHNTMGATSTYVMTAQFKSGNGKYNGRPVEVVIEHSKNNPNQLRVENIQFADAQISSFGNRAEQISGGILTTKPREYTSQVPQCVNTHPQARIEGRYVDIRPYMQNNPLLNIFRGVSGRGGAKVNKPVQRPIKETLEKAKLVETGNTGLYELGKTVNIPRSSGAISQGTIWSVGKIEVTWNEGGRIKSAFLKGEINPSEIGKTTEFTTIDGSVVRAKIERIHEQDHYSVSRSELGELYYKSYLTKRELDAVNQKKEVRNTNIEFKDTPVQLSKSQVYDLHPNSYLYLGGEMIHIRAGKGELILEGNGNTYIIPQVPVGGRVTIGRNMNGKPGNNIFGLGSEVSRNHGSIVYTKDGRVLYKDTSSNGSTGSIR